MLRLPRRWYTLFVLVLATFTCLFLFKRFGSSDRAPQKLPGISPHHYPPLHINKLPNEPAATLPTVQFEFGPETAEARKKRLIRQGDVKELFQRCWASYKKNAWGADELKPVTGTPDTTFGGWGATLVDSLDALWIMGMKDEFEEAVAAVSKIDFTKSEQRNVNVFETTIRYLGGLLGAYDISNSAYPSLLAKAVELGDILYQAFDTPQRIPVSRWDWLYPGQVPSDQVIVAELGSLTLEFTRLSQLTNDSKYYDAVYRIMLAFEMSQEESRIPGLWPTIVDAQHLTFSGTHFTIGGMSDSLYEYLPKEYILLGGLLPSYQTMYTSALTAMKKHLLFRPIAPDRSNIYSDEPAKTAAQGANILFAGNAYLGADQRIVREPQGQHLGCFAGGMVALAAKTFKREEEDLSIAKRLVDGCIWAYQASPLGIMPEVFHMAPCEDPESCIWEEAKWMTAVVAFARDATTGAELPLGDRARLLIKQNRLRPGFAHIRDRRYVLRPEAIESIFILYRITGESYLLDAAWSMLNSIKPATWSEFGNAAVIDVTVEPEDVQQQDLMESFWLAETLKYFYLIFSEPDLVSLDEFVLNTEAHPFRRPRGGQPLRQAAHKFP